MTTNNETFISVDVEAAGPNPGQYSLLSIGACTVFEPQETFYIELRPINMQFTADALAVSGLSLERLAESGLPPTEAMKRFGKWVAQVTGPEGRPVFVALNAPFDWSFANDYFHRYLGHNPFGHSALDIKALYMGLTGADWQETYLEAMAKRYRLDLELTHHALQDALDQATVFRHILTEMRERSATRNGSQVE
ncbi:MAG: 3'-5' exonuclease [Chloroflexi bacterium]|nr:3'-5' exonuclease [Chloroflexota bacterium]